MMGLDQGDLLGPLVAGPPSGISISIGRTPWFFKSPLPGRHLVTPLRTILVGAQADLRFGVSISRQPNGGSKMKPRTELP